MLIRSSSSSLDGKLSALSGAVQNLRASDSVAKAIERFRSDLSATRFHLRARKDRPAMIAILGGTGTGKSTLVNRLLEARDDAPLTASSFMRTYTAGPVAIVRQSKSIVDEWLGVDHAIASPPAQGQADQLTFIETSHDLLNSLSLIDTPDLDGDRPAHHAQADRVFRWADAIVFLVTPEKYQMTELLPYYRLATRYGIPALFVMNKVEEQAVVDDYAKLVARTPFAIPRDDSAFQPSAEADLRALRSALSPLAASQTDELGTQNRITDLLNRLRDTIIDPLFATRKTIDAAITSLRAMEHAGPNVDVSPLMLQLRRRLQQRSVLYLMGPGRVLDRVRQVPGLLARLPRTAWDLVRHGQVSTGGTMGDAPDLKESSLDFHEILADQMRIVQAKIQDVVADTKLEIDSSALIDPEQAGAIADEEIASLKDFLTKKWNATPRDTALLTKMIRYLPGGAKLAAWSEAAPYLLAIVVATHHAIFGPVDLMVLGSWGLATWITERLSNEVTWRAREANASINRRFAQLAHQQIKAVCTWLDQRAPTSRSIEQLQKLAEDILT